MRLDSSGKRVRWAHGRTSIESKIEYYNVIHKVNRCKKKTLGCVWFLESTKERKNDMENNFLYLVV